MSNEANKFAISEIARLSLELKVQQGEVKLLQEAVDLTVKDLRMRADYCPESCQPVINLSGFIWDKLTALAKLEDK